MTITATVISATGARNESFVPAAKPAAAPANARAPAEIDLLPSPPAAYPFTRIAADASTNDTPAMSLSASPAWKSTIVSAPSTTAPPSSACGATP